MLSKLGGCLVSAEISEEAGPSHVIEILTSTLTAEWSFSSTPGTTEDFTCDGMSAVRTRSSRCSPLVGGFFNLLRQTMLSADGLQLAPLVIINPVIIIIIIIQIVAVTVDGGLL